MESKKGNSIYRWMRGLHRDIGFFVVGPTIIYCISGILLTLRETDFLKSETTVEKAVDPGLKANQLGRALHLKGLKVIGENEKEITFTSGIYNKETGVASYTSKELPVVLREFNSLHFTSTEDTKSFFTILYAASLLFFGNIFLLDV